MHIRTPQGKYVADADRQVLCAAAEGPPGETRIRPFFSEALVPTNMAPTNYAVHVGLWIPSEERKIPLRSTTLPHDHQGVTIMALPVE